MTINVSLFVGFHDSGAAFSQGEEVVLCLSAERVFRRKHMRATWAEMEHLVQLGLQEINSNVSDIDTLFIARWGCQEKRFIELLGRRFAPVWTSHHANHLGWATALEWTSGIAICADGGSENGCTGVYRFFDNRYEPIVDLDDTILTGRYYGTITQAIYQAGYEESHVHLPGKTMGLAAFGRYDPCIASKIVEHQKSFTKINADSGLTLSGSVGLTSEFDSYDWNRWDFAFTAQRLWEDKWIELLSQLDRSSDKLIFSGGCALNVQLNERIHSEELFSDIFVPPVPSDDGQAVGALIHQTGAKCLDPYRGRTWGSAEVLVNQAVEDLLSNKIVFWFDGHSEIGPRALGHRSIFASARSIASRRRLSEIVKGREWYRPVAPIVLAEHAGDWFEMKSESPWMARAIKATSKAKEFVPGAIHVDGTSRVQTLRSEQDPILHKLLTAYEAMTGIPMLLNTSMNLPGEPICDSPEDAVRTFKHADGDVLYVCGRRYTQETCMKALE